MQEKYTEFCSHITCEAMYNENLVPVTNRRCLCELAKEIGFLDEAQKIFSLEMQLSTFRHLVSNFVICNIILLSAKYKWDKIIYEIFL